MIIFNQDRDAMIIYSQTDEIEVEIKYFNDVFMGVNLNLNGVLLGTFDSLLEAANEKAQIEAFAYPYYIVSGFSAWDEWETIMEGYADEEDE